MSAAGTSHSGPLDAPPSRYAGDNSESVSDGPRVQQPKPQALPGRAQASSILVSTRQKGNPVIQHIKGIPWEWADTPADYVLGNTTCALFLSLKYHRLHPEYIYTRIKGIGHKFNLRVLLTMVDIQNHEEALKELSKTSLINNVTLILCWSAAEAGRYLELFKSYEHAPPTSIKAHQSTTYADRLVEFITVPRSINKTDAVSLVSTFGSIRAAVNASPEEVALVAGWGGKKVQRWCSAVREPFRVKKAARRRAGPDSNRPSVSTETPRMEPVAPRDVTLNSATPLSVLSEIEDRRTLQTETTLTTQGATPLQGNAQISPSRQEVITSERKAKEPELSVGIAAALEKLRNQ